MKSKRVKRDREEQSSAKTSAALFAFIALAAVTSVLILGYLRFSDSGKTIIEVKTESNTGGQTSKKSVIQTGMQEKLPVARSDMFHPSANSLIGKWFAKIGESGIAEITLDGEKFELVYMQTPQDRLRKFSKGQYKYNAITGYLDLLPKRGENPSLQVKGISYRILTMRKFQMIVLKKRDDNAIYLIAHDHQIIGKTYHPIFLYDDYTGAPVLEFLPVNAASISDKSK